MPFDDPLDRCQPDAVSGVLGFGMQALERPEQLGGVFRSESGAVVADEEFSRAIPADFDPRVTTRTGELPGISHQVIHQVAQQRRIPLRDQSRRNVEDDLARRLAVAQVGGDLLSDRGQIDLRVFQFTAGDAGHLQQRVDQVAHPRARAADPLEIVLAAVVDRVPVALAQQPAESVDRAQRRAQVVGHAVRERLQLLVGVAEFARAQRNARFQRAV